MTPQLDAAHRMLTWFRENGGHIHPSTVLKLDPETGLSVFSTSPIDSDTRLVSCPFDLAVTAPLATLAICEVSGLKEDALVWPAGTSRAGEQWNERMRIAAYLGLHWVWIDRQAESSHLYPSVLRHWPYVESLPAPEQLRTPLYFTEDELRLLEGTNLLGAALDRKKQWEEESGVVRDTLKEVELTRERYLAAATYLSSRAFPSALLKIPEHGSSATTSAVNTSPDEESHPVLLPGVDMLNHARGQPILWLSANVPCPITSQPLPSISLVTTGPQAQDTQLYNNYGAKPNEEFLLGYGFVLSPNPDDTVILKLGFPSLSPAIQSALTQKALDPAKRFALRRDGEIDKDLLEVLRVVIGGGEEEMHVDEEDEHGLHEKEEKEMQLEMDVLSTVGQMLEDKLTKLENGPPEGLVDVREDVRAMCNVYRQGQVEIINAALDKLETRTERLEKLIDQGTGECSCCG